MLAAAATRRRIFLLSLAFALLGSGAAQAQDDGGASEAQDGGGQEILESIFVPYLPHAPFSLTLGTEWVRPLSNGGTYTVVNSRPIKRDSVGRLYEERWLLSPKGSNIPSRMSWIQIADPIEHTLYECNARTRICDLETLNDRTNLRFQPERVQSGPLTNGKGVRTHEDLGAGSFAGLPVHAYRDTTTLNPGTMGNDLPMSAVREYRFSAELGFNLSSVVENAHVGREVFTVSEITTTEPDPHFFSPPSGYKVVDRRKPAN